MIIIEMAKKELTAGNIEFMIIKEIAKIKKTGGHIGFMLIIELAKIEFTGGPYWNYAKYRDGQNKINRRPY